MKPKSYLYNVLRHARPTRPRLLLAVFFAVALVFYFSSCSLIGGSTVKPSAAVESALKQNREDIDKSRKELKDIQGNVSTFEQRISQTETNVTNLQQQITNNTNNNTPFWEIAIPLLLMYAGWEAIKLIKAVTIAKLNAGSTIRNLIGLKERS